MDDNETMTAVNLTDTLKYSVDTDKPLMWGWYLDCDAADRHIDPTYEFKISLNDIQAHIMLQSQNVIINRFQVKLYIMVTVLYVREYNEVYWSY